MSSPPSSSENVGQHKPRSILKNKSSANTLVESSSTNVTPSAASTPGIPDSPTNSTLPHRGFGFAPPVPDLPSTFTRLEHFAHHTHEHSHSNGTPSSPYSASFDPNVSNISLPSPPIAHPTIPPRSSFRPSTSGPMSHSRTSSLSAQSSSQMQEQWTQIMSASLNTLAAQFSAASQSLLASSRGLAPEGDEGDGGPGNEGEIASPPGLTVSNAIQGGQETLLILTRLEAIEKTQSRLLAKMANFETSTTQDRKAHIGEPRPLDSKKGSGIEEVPTVQSEKDKEKLEERKVETMSLNQDLGSLLKNLISRLEGVESRMEGLEGRVDTLSETVRLDQARLYARLLNSTVPLNKTPIHAPPMGNGKPPANFPATKGEFEHLTKERYEHLLKSYGVPAKGDTNAKRQTLREFIGLTPPGK